MFTEEDIIKRIGRVVFLLKVTKNNRKRYFKGKYNESFTRIENINSTTKKVLDKFTT